MSEAKSACCLTTCHKEKTLLRLRNNRTQGKGAPTTQEVVEGVTRWPVHTPAHCTSAQMDGSAIISHTHKFRRTLSVDFTQKVSITE